MKVRKSLLLGTSLLILAISNTSVNAYVENPLKESEKDYTKSIVATLSEEDKAVELLNHNIIVNDERYKVVSIEKELNKDELKEVTEEKKATLKTNNQEYIKSYFGETYSYEDDKYEGKIPITNININTINHGQYQELREKKIEFDNYSKNDLDNIKKEITEEGQTYYLIKVDWQVEKTERIDNQEVPVSYKGTMVYQTVVAINNPNTYEITVTYKGNVANKEKEYTYTALYVKEEIPESIIEEKEEDSPIVTTIIISGLGFGLGVLIFLLTRKNITIYNKTDSGYRTIGRFKLYENTKNVIDISKYNYKIDSNLYSLKLNKSIYKKLKGKVIYIKIENISKPITINEQFIEFIICRGGK